MKSMRALVLKAYGDGLTLVEMPVPAPGPNEVLVRVKASGVNPLDVKIRNGAAPHARTQLPAVLGIDLAGTVEATGAGVNDFHPGDGVYGMTGGVGAHQGSLAEFVVVDADLLAKKPANLNMRESAALPLAFITAWEGLVDRANVSDGKSVLVQGGAGGVGYVAIQLAQARGAHVFATASAPKMKLVEDLGATPINRDTPVEEYVRTQTGGLGFDVIFDTVGGTVLDASFIAVKQYTGHVVSALGWGTHSLAPLSFRGATYSGVFTLLPLLTGVGRAHHGDIMREATKIADANKLVPLVDRRRFTMETIDDAHDVVSSGSSIGKIVVDIAE